MREWLTESMRGAVILASMIGLWLLLANLAQAMYRLHWLAVP